MPRPLKRFHDFIGQRHEIPKLLRLIAGAKQKAEPFPHPLFLGPSGIGKTELALACAAEMGTTLVLASGHDTLQEIAPKLRKLNNGDLLFVDEAHNLLPKVQEALYPVIDNWRLPEWAAITPAQSDVQVDDARAIKPCTIILATDQPSKLLQAMRKRIPLTVELQLYDIAEMKEIVDELASRIGVLITPQVSKRIGEVSRGLPRNAKHHLNKLRLHYPGANESQITLEQLEAYLLAAHIDKEGLSRLDRAYLSELSKWKRASLPTLAGTLSHDPEWLKQEVEAYLLRCGFIAIGLRGRELTSKGWKLDFLINPKHERIEDYDDDSGGQTAD